MESCNVIFCTDWGKGKLDWEELLEEFLILKSGEGKADRTVLDYRRFISIFFRRYPDTLNQQTSPCFKNLSCCSLRMLRLPPPTI